MIMKYTIPFHQSQQQLNILVCVVKIYRHNLMTFSRHLCRMKNPTGPFGKILHFCNILDSIILKRTIIQRAQFLHIYQSITILYTKTVNRR